MMRKQSIKAATALLVLMLVAVLLPHGALAAPDEPATLTVIHVNDRHGRMGADPYISQMAKDLTANGENVLILDAGDALHGQITANLTRGESMVELMNAVGYGAMVTGNHEYTYSVDRMLELAEMMDFPLLAANVKRNGEVIFKAYEVFDINGIRAGVFGIATPETITGSDPRIIAGLTFEDPAQTAAAMVRELQTAGCDVIIALAHLGDSGLSSPQNKSDALAIPGVDVVIDGHSHTKLDNGRMVGDTLIVQAGEYAEHIGVVEITIDGGVTSRTARLIEVGDDLPADAAIADKVAELDRSVEAMTSQVVGYTPVLLRGERAEVRTGDTNLANLISDSMLWATNADIAMISGGNIRASIPQGDITMGHVLTTMPYSNLIVTMELTGESILEALEHGVSLYPEQEGIYIHVSGLSAVFDPNLEAGGRIKSVTMPDGSALDMRKIYTVAMSDFLAAGGDGYSMMANGTNLVYYGGDAEAFVAYLAEKPVIGAEAEGRVTVYQGQTAGGSIVVYVTVGGLALFGGFIVVLIIRRRSQRG